MVVVVAMVVVAVPVMVVMMVVGLVMVVTVAMFIVVVMVVVIVVVVMCAQTKKIKKLVSLGVSLYFHISNLPCSSFKVPVDEFMAETACVCQAGDPQNYEI